MMKHKRVWGCAAAGGLFYSFALLWGKQLDRAGSVTFTALSSWAGPLALAALLTPVLAASFSWRMKRSATARGQEPIAAEPDRRSRKRFWASAGILLAFWAVVLLAVYPGFFAYDATDELQEVLTGQYVTRHPLLHVLLLGKTVAGVQELTGSFNLGILLYVCAQMAVMALLLAWVLERILELGAGRWGYWAGLAFFALFPVIPLYVLCTSKDMPYTAGLLAAVTFLCLLGKDREAFFAKRGRLAGLGCALFAMAAFRNNGFYVFLVMIPALIWLAGRENWKRMALTAALVLAAYLGMNLGLNAALRPVDTGAQETLTVPIQQLARTWAYSPELFPSADREALLSVLPEEALARYTPKLSDSVKIDFQAEAFEKDPAAFFSLWLRTGLKAPFTYANAWLMTSYGFWYPPTVIDVYNGNRHYVDSSWFSFETEEPGQRDSKFPWLEEQYRKLALERWTQQIPVISLFFSPGFLCWVYVWIALYLIAAGRLRALAALLPIYLSWLTVLLGPTYLVRYVLIFWFALPLVLVVSADKVCYTAMEKMEKWEGLPRTDRM